MATANQMPVPVMKNRPKRFAVNNPLALNPKLEPIHQALYSGGSLTGNAVLPRELLLFQYAIGGTVAGAVAMGNASILQTNMRTAGFVAAPKVFLCEGLRFKVSMLTPPGAAAASALKAAQLVRGAASAEQDLLSDVLKILYSGTLDFSVGPKNYQEAPLFCFPDNQGVGGLIATSAASTTSTIEINNQYPAYHGGGSPFRMKQYPVVIPAQQQFQVKLGWPSAVNATISPTQQTNFFVWVFMDGLLGREVS